MELNLLEKKEETLEQKQKKSKVNEKVANEKYRVVLNKHANDKLEAFVELVNSGYIGGKIGKAEVVMYVAENIKNLLSETDIAQIRNQCFSDKDAMNNLARNPDGLPDSIKKAVREFCGISESSKKRSTKKSQEISTKVNVDISNAT